MTGTATNKFGTGTLSLDFANGRRLLCTNTIGEASTVSNSIAIKRKFSFIVCSSPNPYLPLRFLLFDPAEELVPPRSRGAFLAFTSDCTDEGLSPRRALEEP
jgi:hypothetical protein